MTVRKTRVGRPRAHTGPPVVTRRGGEFVVVIPCAGSRGNAERAAQMVDVFFRAHRQSHRGGAGAVRVNELSAVLYALGLTINMHVAPKKPSRSRKENAGG